MPIHRYLCGSCGHEQDELFLRSTDDPAHPGEPCEVCGADPSMRRRLMSAPTPIGPIFSNVKEVAPGFSSRFYKGNAKGDLNRGG